MSTSTDAVHRSILVYAGPKISSPRRPLHRAQEGGVSALAQRTKRIPGSRKVRISADVRRRGSDLRTAADVKQEYKFVDEAAKISVREASRQSTASLTGSKGSTPSLDWSPESAGGGSETPPSLACSAHLEKIDPRLLVETSRPPIGLSTDGTTEFVDLTGIDEEMTPSTDQKEFLKGKNTAHGTCSRK